MTPTFYFTSKIKELSTIKNGKIPLLEVDSSMLKGVGYKDSIFFVLFSNYTIYAYENVPMKVLEGLLYTILYTKESTGKYFTSKIKKGGFPYTKIGQAEYLKGIKCQN